VSVLEFFIFYLVSFYFSFFLNLKFHPIKLTSCHMVVTIWCGSGNATCHY